MLYNRTSVAKEKELYRSLFTAFSVEEDWEKESGLGQFSLDKNRYQELENRLEELLGRSDCFFENLMVMTAFYMTFPNPAGPEALWKSYAVMCGLYSFFRFAAVLGCHKEVSRERLFQVLAIVSRDLLHNVSKLDWLADAVLENSGTMDKIAFLLGG